ncbi:MAG TPA: response regulator [Verrucomicrobiae bacterium]|jgi:CheY-like chemotaxis protein
MNESILIVDDNADDAALIKRAVFSLHPRCAVRVLTCAKELKEWVDGEGEFADREQFPYPCLILLDLRMPEMTGLELLEWLKDQPRHSAIPVIAVSSFDRQREIRKSYQLGARTFLSKPISAEELRTAIRSLKLPVVFAERWTDKAAVH